MEKKGLIGSRKRQKQEETLSHAADTSKAISIMILVIGWAAIVTVLMLPNSKPQYSLLVENQMAPYTVFSDMDFSYEDPEKTEADQAAAKADVALIYQIDSKTISGCLDNFHVLFSLVNRNSNTKEPAIIQDRDNAKINHSPQINTITEFSKSLSSKELNILSLIIRNEEFKSRLINAIRHELLRGIISKNQKDSHKLGQKIQITDKLGRKRQPQMLIDIQTPKDAAKEIGTNIIKYYSPDDRDFLKKTLIKVCSFLLKGDLTYDKEATEKRRLEVAANIPPYIIHIKKGSLVLRKGKIVDKSDILKSDSYLKAQKKQESTANFWYTLSNYSFISLLLIIVVGLFISHIHSEVVQRNHQLALIVTAAILSIYAVYGVVQLFNAISPDHNIHPSQIQIVVPIALASCLLSVFIGLRVGVSIGLLVSCIAALMLDDSFKLIIDGFAVSCVAGLAVRKSMDYKYYFLRTWIAVFLTTVFINYQQFWSLQVNFDRVAWTVGLSFINGITTAILALVLIFVIETIFNVTTDMSLILLCDYNHPLLKRLQFEAPGTYHHSLMVSTLAEQAAEAIGANPIKARVCALFHDIGKMSQPEYFTENDFGDKNKHNELHPRMSSLVILNHVKEGLDMAIKFKLRKVIRDAIEQHHGTDLVKYFYLRAKEDNKGKDAPVEQEYRYPGPLPHDKEVVLVSLADACEAASRALHKPSPAKIEALVWELIRKRIRDHQLDAANLTFGELAKVRKSFVKTITTMLHGRIAYPKDKDDEEDEDDLFKAAKKVSESQKETIQEVAETSD